MDVILQDGIVTDYDDFYLWIEEPKLNAKAKFIHKDVEGEAETITEAVIDKIAIQSQFDSEVAYSEASDEIINNGDYDAAAEFMTADDTFYVSVKLVGNPEPVETFDTGSAEYC